MAVYGRSDYEPGSIGMLDPPGLEPHAHPPRTAEDAAPLFLDEPAGRLRPRRESLPDVSELFLDEDDLARAEQGHPAESPAGDPDGTAGPATAAWTRVREHAIAAARPSFMKALVVVVAILALAGVSVYRARGGSALGLWLGLGF